MSVAMVGAGISAVGIIAGQSAGRKAQKSADAANANAAAIQQQQQDIANSQYADYKETYRPLERSMVAEAQNFDTAAAYDQAASKAQATTAQQIGLAQERLARTPGLDPTSGAAMAAQTKLALSGAAMGATAQNQARTGIRDQAWARKMDALGLGKGLVTNASSGLANAGQTAGRIAANQQELATTTAGNVAGAFTGLADSATKMYKAWNAPKT